MKHSAITPAIASAIERPIHRGVYRPLGGGRRKSITRRLADIFAATAGIWYDPQDLATLYQDAQGTLPVYRPGSGQVDPPVGLMMDKSQGLELGPELVTNGDFSDGATGWTLDVKSSIVDGRLFFTESSSRTRQPAYQAIDATPGSVVRVSFSVELISGRYRAFMRIPDGSGVSVTLLSFTETSKEFVAYCYLPSGFTGGIVFRSEGAATMYIDNVSIREIKGYHAYQPTTTARPTLSGRYNLLLATEALSTQSVTTVATNYTLSFSGTGTVTLSGTAIGAYSAGTHTITCTAGTLTCTVAGVVTRADLRASNDGVGLPPYQRVDSATTYDTTGFHLYLKFDGVDDFLNTASVDLTGTDKVTVGAGLRKITDAVAGAIVCEFSDNTSFNAGSFYLSAPGSPNAKNIANTSRGTAPLSVSYVAIITVSAPATITTLATHDISADRTRATLNGHNETIATGDKGAGNFGNYPLYVGARGGTSLPFKGNIYSLCIIGSLLSTSEQALLERYLNAKTRAY